MDMVLNFHRKALKIFTPSQEQVDQNVLCRVSTLAPNQTEGLPAQVGIIRQHGGKGHQEQIVKNRRNRHTTTLNVHDICIIMVVISTFSGIISNCI